MKTALQVMLELNKMCQFTSIEEKGKKASNSEIRRWLDQSAVHVNFQPIKSSDPWPPILKSIVMFPKSQNRRCTLFFDEKITFVQVKE